MKKLKFISIPAFKQDFPTEENPALEANFLHARIQEAVGCPQSYYNRDHFTQPKTTPPPFLDLMVAKAQNTQPPAKHRKFHILVFRRPVPKTSQTPFGISITL